MRLIGIQMLQREYDNLLFKILKKSYFNTIAACFKLFYKQCFWLLLENCIFQTVYLELFSPLFVPV